MTCNGVEESPGVILEFSARGVNPFHNVEALIEVKNGNISQQSGSGLRLADIDHLVVGSIPDFVADNLWTSFALI